MNSSLECEAVSSREGVDVIAAYGGPPTVAARKASTSIPIVSNLVADPVALGFAVTLECPGGNVTALPITIRNSWLGSPGGVPKRRVNPCQNAPPESGVPKGLDCILQDAAFTSSFPIVRRLFSSFPNGLQGWGLLLLRLTLIGGLFADAATRLHDPDFSLILLGVAEALTGALLLLGLETRIVAILVCVFQLGMLPANPGTIGLHLVLAAVGLCLALTGPGVWSIDAHLFGRRRVEIKSLRDD